jgi:hypothetical protein
MRIVLGLMLVRITCSTAPDPRRRCNWYLERHPNAVDESVPHSLTVRFQKHARGEVFALDRTDAKGWTTASSTILYFDGKARDYRDGTCSGTQSPRRVDRQTIEILQRCAKGESTRLVRRAGGGLRELILDISEQHPDRRMLRRHLILGDNASILKLEA